MNNYRGRGRYKSEAKLPHLLENIKKLVDSQSQIDPTFKSQIYTRLSAAEVRHQLIKKFGYADEELPTSETIRVKLNDLGYRLKILDEVETALNFAKTMTWNGKNPVVKLVNQTYSSGVRLTKKAMQ